MILMTRHLILTSILSLLLIVTVPAAALDLADEPEIIYTAEEFNIVRAVTDGTSVLISTDYPFPKTGPREEGNLHLYNIAEKTLTTIPDTENILPWDTRLSGDDVFWQVTRYLDNYNVTHDVYHYSISSGKTTRLDTDKLPKTGTDYFLSLKPAGGPDPYAVVITAENIKTGDKHIISMPEAADAWTVKISGDEMAFSDMPEKGGKSMYLYNFTTRETALLGTVPNGTVTVLGFSKDTLMYYRETDSKQLCLRDISTKQTRVLSDFPMNCDETDLDGTLAVWRGWYWNDDFTVPNRIATPLYAASFDDTDPPVLLDNGVRQPSVRNNTVVWSKWNDTLERDTILLAKLK